MAAGNVGENGFRPADPSRNAGGVWAPRPRAWALALALAAVALGLLVRIPVLYNAEFNFNSDEAVNALVIKHLLEGRQFSFFNWDATYYGIVEGLLAVPFVALLGYKPLAFKLSAVVGFLILQVSVFFLARRLYGSVAGVAASAALAVFSPMLLLWSTMASGGFCLIVGWGTITILQLDRITRRPSAARVAALGWLLGFGLYIYQLYFVYVAALAALLALLTARELARAASRARAVRHLDRSWVARVGKWFIAFSGAFLIGCAPKLIAHLFGVVGSKQPFYGLAPPGVMYENLWLLLRRCIPAFFGVNLFGEPSVMRRTGPSFPLWAEGFYLGFFVAAWVWGARRMLGGGRLVPAALVLLPVVNLVLFIISPNPQDTLSNRYLLPTLTSLAVLAGGMIAWVGRRSKACALIISCAVIAFGLSKTAAWLVQEKYLTAGLRLARKHEPLEDVLDLLRRRHVRGAFGDYWTAYKATFLSGEEIPVASIRIWDRRPEMTRAVRALPTAAYIFTAPSLHDDAFRERLHDYHIPYERHLIAPYAVYLSTDGGSLGRAELGPLQRFSSSLKVEEAPSAWRANGSARVKLVVTNTGDSVWSAAGGDAGEYRVAASYRWVGPGGVTGVEVPMVSFPRDVRPGETEALWVPIAAPPRAGPYTLVLSLVQERVAWFCDVGGGEVSLPVLVGPDQD